MRGWWKQTGFVNLLVDMAAELDRNYPGRAVYAVGHSPSWLVYTLAELRRARGQDPKTGYIPFSGALVSQSMDQRFTPTPIGSVIEYEANKNSFASEASLQNYFNFLSRRKLDPQSVLRTHQEAGAPVLLDYLSNGKGFASFLRVYDRLAGAQNAGPLGQKFTAAAYKFAFRDGPTDLSVPSVANDNDAAPRTYTVNITSGLAGVVLNILSGYAGCPLPGKPGEVVEDERGRFMPYYPLTDSYKGDWQKYKAPRSGLRMPPADSHTVRAIKSAVATAIDEYINKPGSHRALSAAAVEKVEQQAPRLRGGPERWNPAVMGFHG